MPCGRWRWDEGRSLFPHRFRHGPDGLRPHPGVVMTDARRPSGVSFRGETEALWQRTDCTCGQGDERGHFLRCAKWVAVLPNHAQRDKGS